MRKLMISLVAISFLAGCGVNPDRLATMQQKNAEMAEQGEDEQKIELEYSDSDPRGIRDAISAVNDMEAKLDARDYEGYMTRRYEAVALVDLQASPDVQNHEKAQPIKNAIRTLDIRFAKIGGETATQYVTNDSRTKNASADSLYSLQDAFESCKRASSSADAQMADDLYRKYQASLERAISLDQTSTQYVGKRPNGTGIIDVPAEIAFCEVNMAQKRIEAEDEPPAAEDMSKTYTGCGFYPLAIEAAQTGTNRFGQYQITSVNAQDPDPGAATVVDCKAVPPESNAPSPVQNAIRSGVAWIQETDAISMDGPFEYEQRTNSELFKKGNVRVYRKNATLKTSRCGSEDKNITCEADGSDVARAYNHAAHYMGRADFHRTAGRAERCKSMADKAYKALNALASTGGADKSYMTNEGSTMKHSEIMSRIEALKSQANDVLASDWCANK